MNRSQSHSIFSRAKQLMPGGVNSPARAFRAVGGEPIVMRRGEGAYLFDVDGNRYIDYVGSWGPLIFGHAHPQVVAAITEVATRGTSFGTPTEGENELAELIIDAVASVEKIRLVNSGTEAAMSAIRLARGFTGRDRIIKFAGNYHGHVDSLLVAAGSAAATLSVPNSPGVTVGTTKDTIILAYNDVDGLEQTFRTDGDKIAGVIVEPVVGNMGCVLPSDQFLVALRELTTRHDALLIYDEVMTGFRVAHGGAQAMQGITPDLTTLGKIVGGGLPIGAYGGRADIMEHVLPAGEVYQAGTLSGNPVATAAGCAVLRMLRDDPPYQRLEQLGARLDSGLTGAAQQAETQFSIGRVGSMMTFFLTDQTVCSWTEAARCNTAQFAQFFWGLVDRGVYLPCSQYEALFISAVHTDGDIDATVQAATEVLVEMRAADAVGSP